MADSTPPSVPAPKDPSAPGPGERGLFPRDGTERRRLAAGDRDAFEAFFECWFPRVLGFSRKRVTANADARRVTHAALECALARLDRLPPGVPFERWMLLITHAELERLTHR